MRHHKADKKLGRDSSHRQAMLRNMVTSFFKYDRIETTHSKAKVLRSIAEKMITLAKRGNLHARRQALSYFEDKNVVHKLFDETVKKLQDRQSGYIQIVKKANRKGDNAPVSVMRLLGVEAEKPKKKAKAGEAKKETKKETKPKALKKTAEKAKKTSEKAKKTADKAEKTTARKPKKEKAVEKENKKEDQNKE